jgi:hypothetical protein
VGAGDQGRRRVRRLTGRVLVATQTVRCVDEARSEFCLTRFALLDYELDSTRREFSMRNEHRQRSQLQGHCGLLAIGGSRFGPAHSVKALRGTVTC